jgi:very-short-patch-repair endonuclease
MAASTPKLPAVSSSQALWPASFAARFSCSLSRSLRRTKPDVRWAPFDDQIEAVISEVEAEVGHPLDILFGAAARAIVEEFVGGPLRGIIAGCAKKCESPIEVAMCFALAIAGRRQCDAVYFDFGEKGSGDAEGDVTLCIQPQVQLDRYRVDFLATIQTIRPVGDGFDVARSQVIIECDGHDFHDRTTEQAIRDRSRDRELQLMGFQVFRYAGAEIWRDVFACAEEVLRFLAAVP